MGENDSRDQKHIPLDTTASTGDRGHNVIPAKAVPLEPQRVPEMHRRVRKREPAPAEIGALLHRPLS